MYLVPAFVGLGAPYWDPDARGVIIGLTRGTGLPEIARATLESIAYQVADVVDGDGRPIRGTLDVLRVDGGAAGQRRLLQFQADLLGVPVERPIVAETTAWGAAALAGLAVGFWGSPTSWPRSGASTGGSSPSMDRRTARRPAPGWHRAVERSRDWAADVLRPVGRGRTAAPPSARGPLGEPPGRSAERAGSPRSVTAVQDLTWGRLVPR